MPLEELKVSRAGWLLVHRNGKFIHWSTDKPVKPIAGQTIVVQEGNDVNAITAQLGEMGLAIGSYDSKRTWFLIVEKPQ